MQRRKKTYYKTGFFGYGIFTLTQSRKTLSMHAKSGYLPSEKVQGIYSNSDL